MKTILVAVCVLALLVGPVAPPAAADCCNDFWSCAAAVATGGLSCAVEGLINTVNNLIQTVNNLRDTINTLTKNTAGSAQQAVNDAADKMNSEANACDGDDQSALKSAQQIVAEETNPAFRSAALEAATAAGPATQKSESAARSSAQTGNLAAANQGTSAKTLNSAAVNSQAAPSKGSSSTSGLAGANTAAIGALNPDLQPADSAALKNEMNAALTDLQKHREAGASNMKSVANAAAQAKSQAQSGLQKAQDLAAQLLLTPLENLGSWLTDLVTHPERIFDPSSIVDSMLQNINNTLTDSMDQVAAAVTADANNTLQSAEAPYSAMQSETDKNKQIADAMAKLHKQRTVGALKALYALVPPPAGNNKAIAVQAPALQNAVASSRVPFHTVMANLATARMKAAAGPKQRLQQFAPAFAQIKTIRTQALAIKSSLPTYQQNFSQRLDTYFVGKTATEATAQRDQLLSEARTRFASDPKTRDAVIRLLTEESNRRIAIAPARRL